MKGIVLVTRIAKLKEFCKVDLNVACIRRERDDTSFGCNEHFACALCMRQQVEAGVDAC